MDERSRRLSLVAVIVLLVAIAGLLLYVQRGAYDDSDGLPYTNDSMQQFSCPLGSRLADVCTQEYAPVCGWFNSSQVRCIRYPCVQTFSNSCFACMHEQVAYYTQGECPA